MHPLFWLAIFSLPFFLNDLFFWGASDYRLWLAIDYLFKIAACALIWLWIRRGGEQRWLGLRPVAPVVFVAWTVGLSLLGVAIDQGVPGWVIAQGYEWRLFSFPAIESRAVFWFDLGPGLMLTAVSEELVFRGFGVLALLALGWRPIWAILFSSLLFGLVHWGLGPAVIVTATLWGLLPALSVVLTRSIFPAIIAHYVTNFVDFSGWFF